MISFPSNGAWRSAAVAACLALEASTAGDAAAGTADPAVRIGATFHYVVSARVRPLLFWIGRDNVGDARIDVELENGSDARRYELLIGSDPKRAPFGINRWGYLAERVSAEGGSLLGLMIESDEDSVDRARASVASPSAAVSRFKAIRARVGKGGVEAAIERLTLPGSPTAADLPAVLPRVFDREMPVRRVELPADVAGGFLSAVAAVLDESVATYSQLGRAVSGQSRRFVHGTNVYQLSVDDSRVVSSPSGAGTGRGIESRFEVRDLTTKAKSRFRLTYGVEGRFAGIPLRAIYRPQWWFEAEINIAPGGP